MRQFLKSYLDEISKIMSVEEISNAEYCITFNANFWIKTIKSLSFTTKATLVTDEVIEKATLTEILKLLFTKKYIQLNMQRREFGSFNYEYEHNGKWLVVLFETL